MTSFQAELVALVLRHNQRLSPHEMLQVLQSEVARMQQILEADRAAINNDIDEAAKNLIT